jgi:hypothetical protein
LGAALHPIVINSFRFLPFGDVVAAHFIFAMAMPPPPKIGKIRLLFESEPSVSS